MVWFVVEQQAAFFACQGGGVQQGVVRVGAVVKRRHMSVPAVSAWRSAPTPSSRTHASISRHEAIGQVVSGALRAKGCQASCRHNASDNIRYPHTVARRAASQCAAVGCLNRLFCFIRRRPAQLGRGIGGGSEVSPTCHNGGVSRHITRIWQQVENVARGGRYR